MTVRIAALKVKDVNSILNPANAQPMTIIQDEPDHGFIENVPAFDSSLEHVITAANSLANIAVVLSQAECDEAKLVRQRLAATEGDPQAPLH